MDDVANTELAAGFQPDSTIYPQIPDDRRIIHVRDSVRAIAEDVANRRQVTVWEIFGRAGEHRIAHARQEVMWWARNSGMTYKMIARRFPSPHTASGHMDHTTVLHGVRQHEKRRRKAILARIARDNEMSAIRNRRAA